MLIKNIDGLNNELTIKEGQIKKFDDDLVVFKQQKHFVDILAIQAGEK